MIALASREFQRAVADVAQLPIDSGIFDIAVLAFMLFHAPDPLGALVEVRRVLIPGGTIGVTTWGTAQAFLPDDVWTDELDASGAAPDVISSARGKMDSPEKLTSLFDEAGFHVETIHREAFEQTLNVDELMSLKSSLGPTARRLALLEQKTRVECIDRVRQRLETLGVDALTDHDEVISASAKSRN